MTRYHINASGEPGACSAKPGNCPFGGEANHYENAALARKAFELSMGAQAPRTLSISSEAAASAQMRRDSHYDEFKDEAIKVYTITRETEESTLKDLKDLAEDTPLAIMLNDGTVIYDKAGNGWKKGYKPNFLAKAISGYGFVRYNEMHLSNLDQLIPIESVSEILVLKEGHKNGSSDYPKVKETGRRGAIYRGPSDSAIYTPDMNNTNYSVRIAIMEAQGRGEWVQGNWIEKW